MPFSSTIHTQPLLTFLPGPCPIPIPIPFYSNQPGIRSFLFPIFFPFYQCAQLCIHFFSPPAAFLIPIVGCTIYFTFTFHSPRGNPASSPRFGIVAPTGRRCDLLALLITTYSYYGEGKVVRCVCVGVCVAQEFAVFTGGKPWSIG